MPLSLIIKEFLLAIVILWSNGEGSWMYFFLNNFAWLCEPLINRPHWSFCSPLTWKSLAILISYLEKLFFLRISWTFSLPVSLNWSWLKFFSIWSLWFKVLTYCYTFLYCNLRYSGFKLLTLSEILIMLMVVSFVPCDILTPFGKLYFKMKLVLGLYFSMPGIFLILSSSI